MDEALSMWVDGPHFKGEGTYLSADGDNPEAAWPGYGWPLGTECWYFRLNGRGRRLWATGTTVAKAWERAQELFLKFGLAGENTA